MPANRICQSSGARIANCDCHRCVEGRQLAAIISPPILGESDPRIVIDPKPLADAHEPILDPNYDTLKESPRQAPLTGAPTPVRYAAFDALLREIKTLHDSKGADYESDGVEYSNLTAAEQWGIPAWKYAMNRVDEKLNRLKSYAQGSTLQHEGARDSMIDIAVLSLIAIVLKERAGRRE